MTSIQLWVSVFEIGSFYALMALAYLLIKLGTDFFNFALGAYGMIAALGTSWLVLNHGVSVWLAIGICVVGVIFLSAMTELAVVRTVQVRSSHQELPALISVVALLFLVEQVAGNVFGRAPAPGQPLVVAEPITIGDAVIPANSILLLLLTVLIFVAVAFWMRYSLMGRLLRATGDNRNAAEILGLPVGRVRLVAFLLGGFIAALAGILFATKNGVAFSSGLDWTIMGFLALVIGGTGHVWAPLFGGILLGAVQVFTPYYLIHISPTIVIFLVALVFFALKPEGLFARKVRV